jgi:hypothetical protein
VLLTAGKSTALPFLAGLSTQSFFQADVFYTEVHDDAQPSDKDRLPFPTAGRRLQNLRAARSDFKAHLPIFS